MSMPTFIVLSTSVVSATALVCLLIVTTLTILDYRRRGRVMRRLLTEAEAGRECVQVSEDWARHVRQENP